MNSSHESIDKWDDLRALKSDEMQNSDFLFEESCSSSVFDVEGEADESLTPKRIRLSEASNVMRLGKYRFDQIKVPSSAESFAKGFYAGNIKPDDLTEFSFHRYDGNLLVGKLSETDARDYMLAFPVGSIRGFPNDLNFYLCAQLKDLGSRALVENNVLLPNWGHSNNSAHSNSGCRRQCAGR